MNTEITCQHLADMPRQASATIEGTRYCAACAAEQIEAMLPTSTPSAIANALKFDDRASRIGITGALLLLWSWGKLNENPEQRRTANCIGRVLEELRRIHGSLFYMGDDQQRRAAAPKVLSYA